MRLACREGFLQNTPERRRACAHRMRPTASAQMVFNVVESAVKDRMEGTAPEQATCSELFLQVILNALVRKGNRTSHLGMHVSKGYSEYSSTNGRGVEFTWIFGTPMLTVNIRASTEPSFRWMVCWIIPYVVASVRRNFRVPVPPSRYLQVWPQIWGLAGLINA